MTDQQIEKTANNELELRAENNAEKRDRRRQKDCSSKSPRQNRHQSRNSHFWFETMDQAQTQAEPGKIPQRQKLCASTQKGRLKEKNTESELNRYHTKDH